MRNSINAAAFASILLSLTLITTAQNPTLTFEVASIKPAAENRFSPFAVDPQRFRTVVSLGYAIEWAYDLQGYQVAGGPAWTHRDYFEIEGKTRAPATGKEMRSMLQSLLADRFKLRFHRETRELSTYALIVGSSSSKLQSSSAPCGQDGCVNVGPDEFIAKYATMGQVAQTISNMVDRPVLDRTGLSGRYDIYFKFDPESVKRFDGQTTPGNHTDDPGIFAAIQDFGLKLEPRRAAVEVVVIDAATKPQPN